MLPDSQSIEIKYEDLVARPEENLKMVTGFLELPFYENMLSSYTEKAAHKVGERIKAHHANLSKPLDPELTFKWKKKLSRADQAIAWEIAGPLLQELGYEPGTTDYKLKFIKKGYHRLYESIRWRFKSGTTALLSF